MLYMIFRIENSAPRSTISSGAKEKKRLGWLLINARGREGEKSALGTETKIKSDAYNEKEINVQVATGLRERGGVSAPSI